MKRILCYFSILCCAIAMITSCGQTGRLYLPDPYTTAQGVHEENH